MRVSAGCGPVVFATMFGVIWTVVVLVFNGFIGYTIYQQNRAKSFPTTDGEVASSSIETRRTSDGTTYIAIIEFTYEVDGQQYRGDQYRFNPIATSSRNQHQQVLDRFPVGNKVDVYYDPDKPSVAVLETGVGGTEMFMLLFLTPFNLVMAFIWIYAGSAALRHVRRLPAGGVPIMERPIGTVVRLPRITPLFAAGGAAMGASFVSIFLVALFFGMDPNIFIISTIWLIVIASAVIVYLVRRFKVGTGKKDLVIDDVNGALSLPQTFGRRKDVAVLIEQIKNIRVQRVKQGGSKGSKTYSFAPTIEWIDEDGNEQSGKIADWSSEKRAGELVAWLRERINLPEHAGA